MARYRKKPVAIEAHQWFMNGDHPEDGPSHREGKVVRYFRRPDVPSETPCQKCGLRMHVHGWIDTLEGGHIVCPGDWIITEVAGERYPCKPDIFEATYELADEATPPRAAYIDIIERDAITTDDTLGGSIIFPNEVRINGIPLLTPAGESVKVHEMAFGNDGEVAQVTLTLFARRIRVAAEGDL